MTSPHRKIAEAAAAEANDSPSSPCVVCQSHTTHRTLMHCGARCADCYGRYVRERQVYPPTGNKGASDRSWAYALRDRAKSGQQLTGVQLAAMRETIGRLAEHDDLAEACRADNSQRPGRESDRFGTTGSVPIPGSADRSAR